MELSSLNLSPASTEAIQGLRLQVELAARKTIRAQKNVEDLVILLKISKKTSNIPVTKALTKFTETLTDTQLSFFKTLGIDLAPTEDAFTEDLVIPAETDPHAGKKKVVYRGQVKWV